MNSRSLNIRYYIFIPLIVLLSSIALINCTAKSEKLLKPYLDTLPEHESINASLYHYELLTDSAKKSFQTHQYLEVLHIYQKYLEIFYEAEVPNENQLLYYTGMSLKRLCETSKPSSIFEEFLNQSPHSFKTFGLRKNEDRSIHYNHTHLRKILENRLNYPIESNVLKEYYLENFILEPKTAKEHDTNFEYFYYLVTHFPNMLDYSHLLNNPNLINPSFLNQEEREKLENIEKIIKTYNDNRIHQQNAINISVFSKTGGLVLRSRSSLLSSRNFARLTAWEPLTLIRSVTGEDGHIWWEVAYKEISNPKAYIPATKGFLTKIETLDGTTLILNQSEKSLKDIFSTYSKTNPKQKTLLKQYLVAVQAFYAQDYIIAVEKISRLIPQTQGKTRERTLTLLYKTLHEITKRSTSLENDYTDFVRTHSRYFRIPKFQHSEAPKLKITDSILKMLIETNPRSVMLQYYAML